MEPISQDLFFKWLDGQTTLPERQQVQQWLQHEPDSETYFLWLEAYERRQPQHQPNLPANWAKLQARLSAPQAEGVAKPTVPLPTRQRWFYLVAACLALALVVAGWAWRDYLLHVRVQTAYGQVLAHSLPDGSTVVLNANTQLHYPRFGFAANRTVTLVGEAEFDVRHQPDHAPFLVKTNGLTVKVLGTRFVVFGRATGSRVFLKEGQVELQTPAHGRVLMRPGELVRTGPEAAKAAVPPQPQPLDSMAQTHQTLWQQHRFVFDHTTLAQVAQQVEEQFGVAVRFGNPELALRQVTGDIEARSADELLQSLAVLLDLELRPQPGAVELVAAPPGQ
jgi:ferric-dicitrate binding protein FerR (iron transport regulator)